MTTSESASSTWCEWHHGYTDTGRVITVIEQGTGPGAVIYACAPCREKHRLTPWAEHPHEP